LAGAVNAKGTFDKHNAKITKQRSSLLTLIETWRTAGELSEENATEAIDYVSSDDPFVWHPFLYVIPVSGISDERVTRVSLQHRAGLGPEYLIKDLAGNEFDRIRL
jgi:hypothetical protein